MLRDPSEARARTFLILSLTLLSLLLVPSSTHPVTAQNPNILYIDPPQQAPVATSTVTYQVKVAQMDPFNTWEIQVKTDPAVLNPVSLSVTPNTLTANFSITVLELTNCINGLGTGCNPSGGDAAGVVHSAVFPLGNSPSVASISGVLFTITYSVVNSAGCSGVLIFNDKVVGNGYLVPHATKNGIYGNCQLPVVDFYWTPSEPVLGQVVSFISTASDPNPGASIVSYTWDYGDAKGPHRDLGANVTNVYTGGGEPVSAACGATLKFTVQLTITDSLGIQNSQTHLLLIIKTGFHDIAVDTIVVSPADAILAGTVLTLKVLVGNHGTLDEGSFNVSISVEHRPLANATFDSKAAGGVLACTQERSFQFSWNTAGLAPRSYEIEAFVSPLRNATSPQHELLETNLQNNMFVHIVRIIVPMGSSLIPLTLPESMGVAAVLVVVTGLVRMVVSREGLRKRRLDEELA